MSDSNSRVLSTMSDDEYALLNNCEARIERGLETFIDVGNALMVVKERRLYRAQYATFEDYLRQKWHFARSRGYQIMDAAQVASAMSTFVDTPPDKISHALALKDLEPEQAAAVWKVVQDTAPNGEVTAAHIKSVATVFKEVLVTKALDDGSGEQIHVADAVTAQITEETYERLQRQAAHITANSRRETLARAPIVNSQSEQNEPGYINLVLKVRADDFTFKRLPREGEQLQLVLVGEKEIKADGEKDSVLSGENSG